MRPTRIRELNMLQQTNLSNAMEPKDHSKNGKSLKSLMSKKNLTLLLTILCLFCTGNLFAGNPVSVKSGKSSVLKESSTALLEIDYSTTTVGKQTLDEYLKSRGDDFVRDWPRDKEVTATYFKERFNKKSKGLHLTTDASAASYKVLIRVNNLDMGNGGSAFVPFASAKAGGVIMTGTVDIIDLKTNEVVCSISVDEVKGLGTPSETARLGLMYFELATQICKLK